MKIGICGLGKMGEAIAYRLLQKNFSVFGFDPEKKAREHFATLGGTPVETLADLAQQTNVVWLMVPAGRPVDDVLANLTPHLDEKTIVIDGGNSHFPDTVRRAKELATKNIFYLDCGTSGGLRGREIGFSLMIGGDADAFEKVEPLFQAIAAPSGYAHLGPSGAGHYVKMVHNGVEYALLQAYADGFNLLKHGEYEGLNPTEIARVWSNGSVVRSWIVDLLHEIFQDNPDFSKLSGAIGENLTGQWTLEEAKRQDITMDLVEKSLERRAWSRETGGDYATKLVALLRNKFGGHEVKKS